MDNEQIMQEVELEPAVAPVADVEPEIDTTNEAEPAPKEHLSGWQRKKIKIERLEREQEALIDFYEGRDPNGDSIPPRLWAKIKDARQGGPKPRELEVAYKGRESREQQQAIRDAVTEALPLTPDYNEYAPDDVVEARAQQIVKEREWDALFTEHESHVADAKQSLPDYDQVLAPYGDVPIHPAIGEAVTRMPNGPLVMYEAARSGQLEQILNSPPVMAVAALGRISAELDNPPEARTTKAPAPPQPVKKVTQVREVDIYDDNVPYDRWVKAREKGINKGKR